MRTAVIAHLFYEDLARDLIRRLKAVDVDFDLFVTGKVEGELRKQVTQAYPKVEFIPSASMGFDIAPFLDALAVISGRGYDIFCKVHTKRGDFAFGERWREASLGVIRSAATVRRIVSAFQTLPDLAVAGPAALYLSARANMLGNRENIETLFARCFPGVVRPDDWGFFAGTMFWGRTNAFAPFLQLRKGTPFPAGLGQADGHPEHALERLFGLAGWPANGRVGLLRDDGGEPLLVSADPPPDTPINEVLARLGRPDAGPSTTEQESKFIGRLNPLLHYLRFGREDDLDPNLFFNNRWYIAANPGLDPNTTALADFVARKGMTPPPSPLVDLNRRSASGAWQVRLGINPLVDIVHPTSSRDESDRGGDDADTGGLSIAIKIPAERSSATVWGDTAFAEGLAGALERLGHRPALHFREEWYGADAADAVIVLRGPIKYEPRRGPLNILWSISHPDQVTLDEMEQYDRVYVASDSYARLIAAVLDVPVAPLLQATDSERFSPVHRDRSGKVVFVGNSRGEDRVVVRWAIEQRLEPVIFGTGWEDFAPERLVEAPRIDNRRLAELYGAADAVLNDHWPAMKAYGYVSNRLFDIVAAGGVAITDTFPAVRRVLGSAVIPVEARKAMVAAVGHARQRRWASRLSAAKATLRDASFDARAAQIAADLGAPTGKRPSPGARRSKRKADIQVLMPPRNAPWGHLTFSRLALPLTQDILGDLDIQLGTAEQLQEVPPGRVLMLSSEALAEPATSAVIVKAKAASTRIIIDHCERHRASDGRARRARPALDLLASEIWTPDRPSIHDARAAPPRRSMPNAIDERAWRDFHARLSFSDATRRLRVLLLCDGADAWLSAFLTAALKEFAGRVEYVLVGSGAKALRDSHSGVRAHEPPASRDYLRHARWLRDQPQFHVGICGPGPDADRRYLECAALGAVPVIASPMRGAAATAPDRGVSLRGDETVAGAIEAVGRVLANPLQFEAIGAAARDHVWKERNAASVAAIMRAALEGRDPDG